MDHGKFVDAQPSISSSTAVMDPGKPGDKTVRWKDGECSGIFCGVLMTTLPQWHTLACVLYTFNVLFQQHIVKKNLHSVSC